MAAKKKRQPSSVPANQVQPAAPAPVPQAAVPEAEARGSSGRLALFIVVIGIVAVLGLGGAFVFLNSQQPTNQGGAEPQLARNWNVGPVNQCHGSPQFPITKLGFSRSVVFSTSERLNKGLELIEPGPNGDLTNGKHFQDPTWTMGGYLGVFVVDSKGNVYVAPSPRISLIDNPPDKANILYKVDTVTGVMSEFIKLPSAAPPSPENPYGILALSYDCDTDSLYVTSVMGSTRSQQVGRIYRIDVKTGKVAGQFDNVDGFGVAGFNFSTGKRLYFGSARTPEIFSIALDGNGNFWGEPRREIVLTGTYNKARRLDFNQRGELLVRAIDFNFTLSATSEDRRTDYVFDYDDGTGKWVQVSP